jgi:hypothetical protein
MSAPWAMSRAMSGRGSVLRVPGPLSERRNRRSGESGAVSCHNLACGPPGARVGLWPAGRISPLGLAPILGPWAPNGSLGARARGLFDHAIGRPGRRSGLHRCSALRDVMSPTKPWWQWRRLRRGDQLASWSNRSPAAATCSCQCELSGA